MTGNQFKSLWKGDHSSGWSFYCPLCRSNRRVAHQPTPNRRHYLQLALTTVALTAALWPVFSWKGFVCFVPLTVAFEVIYRSRARVALNCPHCGFDPYLYLVDTKRARAEIEAHWRKKFSEKGIPYPENGKSPVLSGSSPLTREVNTESDGDSPAGPQT
jgi:hypothetical protein